MMKKIIVLCFLTVVIATSGCANKNVEYERTPAPSQAMKIPPEILNNTVEGDMYFDLLNSSKKIILTLDTDCSGLSFISKVIFNKEVKENKIEKFYDVKFAEKSNNPSCKNGSKSCLEVYLNRNCDYEENQICVINPTTKEILFDGFSKELFGFLAEHKYW